MEVSAGPSPNKAATTGTDLAKVLATMKREPGEPAPIEEVKHEASLNK